MLNGFNLFILVYALAFVGMKDYI